LSFFPFFVPFCPFRLLCLFCPCLSSVFLVKTQKGQWHPPYVLGRKFDLKKSKNLQVKKMFLCDPSTVTIFQKIFEIDCKILLGCIWYKNASSGKVIKPYLYIYA
jgi:hypothetical protein